jgi:UDP-GlcNAc:undecaprenyl-phosphate/decaprenyl-phosphate GlcNAc-1-phosphate transferase
MSTMPANSLSNMSQALMLSVLSCMICIVLIVLSRRTSILVGRAGDVSAVQAMHDTPTPRLGGLAIFFAFLLSTVFAPVSISDPYRNFVLATSVLFVVGLLEDLGYSVSPRKRLLACGISSGLVIWLLGVWMPRLGVPGVDGLVSHWYIGVPLTLLITAGVANGFNLIDGVNGLASLAAMVTALCLVAISNQAGYGDMELLALLFASGVFGFFLLNYPFGLIFLGDGGAYTIGFVLSWFGISVLLNAPTASPWAILLTMFWPLADTLLAIFRRFGRSRDAMAPDRLHVHQLLMRALEIHMLGRGRRSIANPLSTVVLAPFVITPPLVGVYFWDQNMLAFLWVIFFLVAFFASYRTAFWVLPRLPRKNGCNK